MNRILITAILMLSAMLSCSAVTANDAMARSASAINGAPGLQAAFTAHASDGTEATGQLLMAHEKFAMATNDYGIWYDGTDLCSYYKSTGEATLTDPTEEELLETNPFDIINHYQTQYKASMLSENDNSCVVRLVPIKPAASIRTAVITIDSKTWLPSRIEVVFANNSSLVVDIAGIATLKAAPDASHFKFPRTSFPDAEIIDLR